MYWLISGGDSALISKLISDLDSEFPGSESSYNVVARRSGRSESEYRVLADAVADVQWLASICVCLE